MEIKKLNENSVEISEIMTDVRTKDELLLTKARYEAELSKINSMLGLLQ